MFGISALLGIFTVGLAIVEPGGPLYAYVWRVTVPFCSAVIIAVLMLMARPVAIPDDNGLTIINVIRKQRFDWNQIVSVRFAADAPWASLDISDGRNVAVMAIQNSDGMRARRAAQQLADLVLTHGPDRR